MSQGMLAIVVPAVTALLGALAGAGATYHSATSAAQVDVLKSLFDGKTSEEKVQYARLAVGAGLLKIPASELSAIFAENHSQLPNGFNCGYTWCIYSAKVSLIKQLYLDLKFYDGPIDNNADAEFGKATFRFQQSVGLTPDGIVGAATFVSIQHKSQEFGRPITV